LVGRVLVAGVAGAAPASVSVALRAAGGRRWSVVVWSSAALGALPPVASAPLPFSVALRVARASLPSSSSSV
jgi:hypothetical protein